MTLWAGWFLRCSHGLRRLKADLMKLFSSKLTYFTLGKTQRLQVKQGKKCFSFLLHTKSIPFYITLLKRAVTDISPGQLLHTVCFTCKHTYVHKKITCKPSALSQLFPLSLPLVPFNIPRQVKVFWVALNSAAPIMPLHITTGLTCSDCNLHPDASISQFKSIFFFSFYDTQLWLTGDGERVWHLAGCDSHSNWQLCQYETCVYGQWDTGS